MNFETDFTANLTSNESSVGQEGAHSRLKRVAKWSDGPTGTGNRLIHGDNLAILRHLSETEAASFRLIYLDPPYNNGESYSHYFDSLGHDEWLAALTKRLIEIKTLLTDDGSVWISIDDSELHYLKVACDTVFGRENFIATLIWERRTTRENRRAFSRNHEYLLVYASKAKLWTRTRNTEPPTQEMKERYRNPDKDPRGPWQSISANVQSGHATPNQFYFLESPSGVLHAPPKGRCWVYNKTKMLKEIDNNNIWFGSDGQGAPRIKSFLSERKRGVIPETIWQAGQVGTTSEAKKELIRLFERETLFDTPKPERLIRRIISIASNPGDKVLDPYLGSGTFAAVAHKMGRKYTGIEIGAHITTHCVRRLHSVISGEPGGVSAFEKWSGGGGFDFFSFRD